MECNPNWWKDLPCHLSPLWNLHGTSELDLRKLKRQIKDDLRIAPDFMKAESLLYLAFLEVPPTTFLNRGSSNPQKALKFLAEAEDYVKTILKDDLDAQNGYGIVVYAFRMWIYSERTKLSKKEEVENILKKLKASQTQKSQAFVNVTLAAALSRLGLHRYVEASKLFSKALEQYPRKIHWMFGRALMLGRLARSARSRIHSDGNVPHEITEQFERERELLAEIKMKDPSFAWPIAYLGQCLFNLKREEDAITCLDQAISMDQGNTDIALISARVYKWIGQSSKSEEILVNLPKESKTPEVLFQIGLIYNVRARKVSLSNKTEAKSNQEEEINQLLRKALEYMEYAVEEDDCHFPAAIKCAEISARLGDNEEANDKYLNLFQRKDLLPVTQFHIRRSANFVKHVLEPTDVLDNIHKLLDLCVRNFTTFDENGFGTIEASVKKDAEIFFQELEAMGKDENNELRWQATIYLAEVQRMMGKYDEAKQLITGVLMNNDQQDLNEAELRWILGKCHCGLGELTEAESQADTLKSLPFQPAFPSDELYADVYLKKAQERLSVHSSISKDLEDYNFIIENLRKAIRKGSIEACYFYLTKVDSLQERLCSVEENIPQTLAEISKCIERNNTYHKDFPVMYTEGTSNDPVNFIKKRIEYVLIHPMARVEADVPQGSMKRFTFLSETRNHLFEFERCYLQVCNSDESWSQCCQKAAEQVLSNARKLLDHVIFDYQKRVLKDDPAVTQFPVHFDWKEAKEDRDGVRGKFSGYLKSKFPGYTMPDEIINYFVELQPMFSKDNLWLPALGSFTVEDKHKGTNSDCDVFNIVLKKADPIPYKKVDLVRRSCFEVEKISEFILNFLQKQFN